ncbi:Dps family protein [Actinacidiphila sp. bgisy160]|uniref:Dps family protein n=1 Tax=Actinacidiphila sp. bgisy160 TaxID=3413796 RepID=UPI003D752316
MTTSSTVFSTRRREEAAATGFTASRNLAEALQQILVDLIELHSQTKQAHWNVVGRNFRTLHLQLDQIADATRDASDTVAERMRAIRAVPDGRSQVVVTTTTLPEFPAGQQDTTTVVGIVTRRLQAAISTVRDLHDVIDGEDPATADLLHMITDVLEKHAWMVAAENGSDKQSRA